MSEQEDMTEEEHLEACRILDEADEGFEMWWEKFATMEGWRYSVEEDEPC